MRFTASLLSAAWAQCAVVTLMVLPEVQPCTHLFIRLDSANGTTKSSCAYMLVSAISLLVIALVSACRSCEFSRHGVSIWESTDTLAHTEINFVVCGCDMINAVCIALLYAAVCLVALHKRGPLGSYQNVVDGTPI